MHNAEITFHSTLVIEIESDRKTERKYQNYILIYVTKGSTY